MSRSASAMMPSWDELSDDELESVSGGKGPTAPTGSWSDRFQSLIPGYGIYAQDSALRGQRDEARALGTTEGALRGDMLHAEHATGLGGALMGGAVGWTTGATTGALSGSVFGPAGTAAGVLGGGLVTGLAGASAGQGFGVFYGEHFSQAGAQYHAPGLVPGESDATANWKMLTTPDGTRAEIPVGDLPFGIGATFHGADAAVNGLNAIAERLGLPTLGHANVSADGSSILGGAYNAEMGRQFVYDRLHSELEAGHDYNVIPGMVITPNHEPTSGEGPASLADVAFGHGTESMGTPWSAGSYDPFQAFAPSSPSTGSSGANTSDFGSAQLADYSGSVVTTQSAPAATDMTGGFNTNNGEGGGSSYQTADSGGSSSSSYGGGDSGGGSDFA